MSGKSAKQLTFLPFSDSNQMRKGGVRKAQEEIRKKDMDDNPHLVTQLRDPRINAGADFGGGHTLSDLLQYVLNTVEERRVIDLISEAMKGNIFYRRYCSLLPLVHVRPSLPRSRDSGVWNSTFRFIFDHANKDE